MTPVWCLFSCSVDHAACPSCMSELLHVQQEAEGPPQDPGAKLGATGQAFVKQLSMRLRATVGLPPLKPAQPRHVHVPELEPNPALHQAQQAIQHTEHVAGG